MGNEELFEQIDAELEQSLAQMDFDTNQLSDQVKEGVENQLMDSLESSVRQELLQSALANELANETDSAGNEPEQAEKAEPAGETRQEPTAEGTAGEKEKEKEKPRIGPEELHELVKQARELLLNSETQRYIQEQVKQITQEIKQLRMAGLPITQQEVETVIQEAFERGLEPATYFKLYSHERLKNYIIYGQTKQSPIGFGAFNQTGQNEPYRAPEFAYQLGLVARQQEPAHKSEAGLPDFEEYLKEALESSEW